MDSSENWAIIGRNGSGKSFLLRILSGNLFPSTGIVKIFGKQLGFVNIWDLRKEIGFVSDHLQREYDRETRVINVIYSGFFASNGLYQDVTDEMKEKVVDILEFLEIFHLRDRVFGHLSSGEQKKVLIARSLVFSPKLLIFDEPCNNLDLASKEDVLHSIQKLVQKGHNIVFVTHHIEEIIPQINNVLFLKEGKIIKSGDKVKMMNKKLLNNLLSYKFGVVKKNGWYYFKHF